MDFSIIHVLFVLAQIIKQPKVNFWFCSIALSYEYVLPRAIKRKMHLP